MSNFNIAIIGLGPRGLYSLRQLVIRLQKLKDVYEINVHLIEPNEIGAGAVYCTSQPHYVLMNTVGGQITACEDISVNLPDVEESGQPFLEWVNKFDVSFNENDYPSRSLHGKYLIDTYEEIKTLIPSFIVLHEHKSEVIDIINTGELKTVCLRNGVRIRNINTILITACKQMDKNDDLSVFNLYNGLKSDLNGQRLKVFNSPYPLDKKIATIGKKDIVGILGLGLSAIDIIIGLTEGKGGSFERSYDGKLKYNSTGLEPKLIAWSRSGLPLRARGKNQKQVNEQYKANFLTIKRVDELRKYKSESTGSSKLNFKEDILPEIIKEMEFVYYKTMFGDELDKKSLKELICNIKLNDRFSFDALLNPSGNLNFDSESEYKSWLLNYLSEDLEHAEIGNVKDPIKASCDVLRDIRDNIRYAVEFGGLTASSQQYFNEYFSSINNFLAVGPPAFRIEQILALIDAGILDITIGKNPKITFDKTKKAFNIISYLPNSKQRHINVLVDARVRKTDVFTDRTPFIRNLMKRGHISPFYNQTDNYIYIPGGVAIDENNNPITSNGESDKSLTIHGVLAEGPLWFTAVAARPGVNSRAIRDAGKWAIGVINQIEDMKNDSKVYRNIEPYDIIPV